MVDKNQSVINFLMRCPQIRDNPTYFNFSEAADNNKSILVVTSDKMVNKPYVDGSVLKRYMFTIIDFKSVVYQALPMAPGLETENVAELRDVQSIMDWIEEQNDSRNYPDFGEKCLIDSMTTATNNPNLNGVDTNVNPNLAKYSITIIIEYLDNSKRLWS